MDTGMAHLLREVPLFAALDEGALQLLGERCRRRKFRAGEALFHEGDPGHTLYVVLAGHVKIQTLTDNGDIVHIATRGPRETVGEMSLIDGQQRMADAVTAEPAELLMLDRDEFIRCLERSPRMALQIMSCLASRLREAAQRQRQERNKSVPARVAAHLLQLAEERGVRDQGGVRLEVRLSQGELAEELGVARESLNRALSSFRRTRVLQMQGHEWLITDPQRLRKLSQW